MGLFFDGFSSIWFKIQQDIEEVYFCFVIIVPLLSVFETNVISPYFLNIFSTFMVSEKKFVKKDLEKLSMIIKQSLDLMEISGFLSRK